MLSICRQCGNYHTEYQFEEVAFLCVNCGYRQEFVRLPLFVITGASGAGKSTIALHLAHRLSDFVVLEVDTFLQCAPLNIDSDYREFRDYCLRVAREVMQHGHPVVLVGSATPGQYESCLNIGFFSKIVYCALVTDNAVLAQRLEVRPDWRASSHPQQIDIMLTYNQWFKDNAAKFGLYLVDNSTQSIEDTVGSLLNWLNSS
ncbi:MAG: ATP-binding protein [Chloroflexi bacterium]|nr:ATP-binding protein [Chloroflexota bacterium]